MRILTAVLIMLATPCLAEDPMSAAEFDAYTRGSTLTYGVAGQSYGAEEYLDGRRVRWSFLDGRCKDGSWYEQAGQICFVYDDAPVPQCWTFHREAGRMVARYQNRPGGDDLYETARSDKPLLCLGPEVGV